MLTPDSFVRRVLIFGKTYPELSEKYIETVCTGGVLEDGTPVRLYPIFLRYLKKGQNFKKYQWIKATLYKDGIDPRPESHKVQLASIEPLEQVPPTKDEWGKRAEFIFKSKKWQFPSVESLWEQQRQDRTSLGVVEPAEILGIEFDKRPDSDRVTFEEKLNRLRAKSKQKSLFEDDFRNDVEIKNLQYVEQRISVNWRCKGTNCNGHNMQILDWEVVELQRREGDVAALKKVKEVLDIKKYAVKFFLGNMRAYPTSFTIVGIWRPLRQPDLLW